MFPGIGALPEPATESHVVNRGTPVAPCRLKAQRKRVIRVGSPCSPVLDCRNQRVLCPFKTLAQSTCGPCRGAGRKDDTRSVRSRRRCASRAPSGQQAVHHMLYTKRCTVFGTACRGDQETGTTMQARAAAEGNKKQNML